VHADCASPVVVDSLAEVEDVIERLVDVADDVMA
jgi:hypothetical protein